MAVHIALHEIGVPFETKPMSFSGNDMRAPNYLKLNPEGKVPTLLIGGRPLTEVAAILYYLAKRFPRCGRRSRPRPQLGMTCRRDSPRHCEERSDEAIQLASLTMDCFASLAMTVGERKITFKTLYWVHFAMRSRSMAATIATLRAPPHDQRHSRWL
jgi:hypothetical protein